MPEHSTDLSREINSILETNSGLADMFNRAAERPAEVAISAISGHQPSIDAAQMAGELGVAKVDFVGPEAGTEKEKTYHAIGLANTLEARKMMKIEKIYAKLTELQGRVRDSKAQKEAERLQAQLAKLIDELKDQNFLAQAEGKLFGDFAPVWLAVLRAYAGEYQAVVGGGDCPSVEFIKALLLGTSESLGRLSSTYVLTGLKPEGFSPNYITRKGGSEMASSRVLAITDPAFEPLPSPEQRAEAAYATAEVSKLLFPQVDANIAFTSYGTGSSGKGDPVERDKEAYQAYKDNYPDSPHPAYGPIQFDAAINEGTATNKLRSFVRSLERGELKAHQLREEIKREELKQGELKAHQLREEIKREELKREELKREELKQEELKAHQLREEIKAYQLIAGLATIISVQNLEVGNILVKAMHATWNLSVEMGPLILPHDRISSATGSSLVASDLSRGEKSRSITATLAALSILSQSIQVK